MVSEYRLFDGKRYTLHDTANTAVTRDRAKAVAKEHYHNVRVVKVKGMSKRYRNKYLIYVRDKRR